MTDPTLRALASRLQVALDAQSRVTMLVDTVVIELPPDVWQNIETRRLALRDYLAQPEREERMIVCGGTPTPADLEKLAAFRDRLKAHVAKHKGEEVTDDGLDTRDLLWALETAVSRPLASPREGGERERLSNLLALAESVRAANWAGPSYGKVADYLLAHGVSLAPRVSEAGAEEPPFEFVVEMMMDENALKVRPLYGGRMGDLVVWLSREWARLGAASSLPSTAGPDAALRTAPCTCGQTMFTDDGDEVFMGCERHDARSSPAEKGE